MQDPHRRQGGAQMTTGQVQTIYLHIQDASSKHHEEHHHDAYEDLHANCSPLPPQLVQCEHLFGRAIGDDETIACIKAPLSGLLVK